jgi:hypothetical protein
VIYDERISGHICDCHITCVVGVFFLAELLLSNIWATLSSRPVFVGIDHRFYEPGFQNRRTGEKDQAAAKGRGTAVGAMSFHRHKGLQALKLEAPCAILCLYGQGRLVGRLHKAVVVGLRPLLRLFSDFVQLFKVGPSEWILHGGKSSCRPPGPQHPGRLPAGHAGR